MTELRRENEIATISIDELVLTDANIHFERDLPSFRPLAIYYEILST